MEIVITFIEPINDLVALSVKISLIREVLENYLKALGLNPYFKIHHKDRIVITKTDVYHCYALHTGMQTFPYLLTQVEILSKEFDLVSVCAPAEHKYMLQHLIPETTGLLSVDLKNGFKIELAKEAGITARKTLKETDNLKVILYSFKSPDIKISEILYFNGENLHFDGYDIGKRVKECWGDSDYEYDFVVHSDQIKKLYMILNMPIGNKRELLNELYDNYNGGGAYSRLCAFFNEHGIQFESFTY